MEEQTKGLNIRVVDLWHIVKGAWIVLLAVLIVFTSGTYIFMAATHEDEYTAEVTLWSLRDSSSLTNTDVTMGKSLIEAYKILIKSDRIADQVKKDLGMPTKISDLKSMVSISADGDSGILTLSITTSNRARAQQIANVWGRVFCEAVNDTMSSGDDSSAMIKVWQEASLPTEPSNPVKPLYALLIGVLATILVYVAYLIRFILDDKVTTPEDVEKYLGLNVLGAVPDKNSLRRRRVKPD